jgi:hypothetical protein
MTVTGRRIYKVVLLVKHGVNHTVALLVKHRSSLACESLNQSIILHVLAFVQCKVFIT